MISSYTTKRNQYLLLLKADEFLRDRCITAALRAYDGPVVGMSTSPAMPKNRHFDTVLKGDPHLAASALQAVKDFELETGLTPQAVIPVTEMSLQPALEIATLYGLPFLPRSCVERARNKDLMKAAFLHAGLPTSRFEVFSDFEGLKAAVQILGFPIIIKPTAAAHSIGVIRVDDESSLAKAFEYCRGGLESVKDAWRIENPLLQAEQYFDASREVSVEVVNHKSGSRVIAITEKYLTAPPYFAEVGHMIPSADGNNADLEKLAINACRSLGIDRGVSHVEVRVNRHGDMSLIEVAARPGGDGIMDLVERAYGVNMYDLHIRSYLDIPLQLSEAPALRGVSAIAFMQTRGGIVHGVNQVDELPREIVSLYLNAKTGDRVGGSLDYDARLGTVEFFWPNERKNLGTRHLDEAAKLAAAIFDVR